MNKKCLMIVGLLSLLVFAGCSIPKTDATSCESMKGTCEYYGCMSEKSSFVSHKTMYSTQHLACLKEVEVVLLEEERRLLIEQILLERELVEEKGVEYGIEVIKE